MNSVLTIIVSHLSTELAFSFWQQLVSGSLFRRNFTAKENNKVSCIIYKMTQSNRKPHQSGVILYSYFTF